MVQTTIKELEKIFKVKLEYEEIEKIPLDKRKMYLSNDNVIGIVPKTQQFKELILSVFSFEDSKINSVPIIDYEKGLSECILSSYYIPIVANICKTYKNIKIKTGKGLPLHIETKDFKIYIATTISI